MYDEMTASELASLLGTNDEPFLLDVREPDEVEAWAIPGVVNIPLGQLEQRWSEIPTDRQVVAVCASGNRSGAASAALAAAGHRVANLVGGMSAWSKVYDLAMIDVDDAQIVQVRRRAKGCLSYLVGAGDQAFVVDPSIQRTYVYQVRWRTLPTAQTPRSIPHLLKHQCGKDSGYVGGEQIRFLPWRAGLQMQAHHRNHSDSAATSPASLALTRLLNQAK